MASEESVQGGAPDPRSATSAAEFVAQMRALRQWSGLTMRQVAKKAEDAGDVLPHSTLAAALGRASLPKEELVAAFVRACGGDQDTVDRWVAIRKKLAAAAAGQPEPVDLNVTADAADEPRVRPPWGLLDTVPEPPAELAPFDGWTRDDTTPETRAASDQTAAPAPSDAPSDASSSGPSEADLAGPGELPAEPAGLPGADGVPAEPDAWPDTRVETGAAPDVRADAGVRSYTYSDGTLATAAKSRRTSAWSGLHRRRDPETGEATGPIRLRDLVPPVVFRAGWSSRVLLGVMVLLLVLVATGVLVRALRDVDGDGGTTGVGAQPTIELDDSETVPDDDEEEVSEETPATEATSATPPKTSAPARTTPPAVTMPAAGKYLMMPAATLSKSYCVAVGPQPGGDRPHVAVIGPCAQAEPEVSELRKVSANTYQIYWADPSGGGGCVQVDPDPNGQPSTADGQLLAPRDTCARPDQRFTFEPVKSGGTQGYKLHAATAPKMCVGTIGGATAAGTAVAQVPCRDDAAQVFVFRKK
ncbi:hypothetical protein K1W54_22750 [Micromonospora sp. CPCC 205371]|nr:hypothetical protein [Micromonospora sp. CPCC 205371]